MPQYHITQSDDDIALEDIALRVAVAKMKLDATKEQYAWLHH